MQKQKGFAPILIILLIALAVGGYFVYQNLPKSAPKPASTIQQTTQPSTLSSTPADTIDISNWKTHTSTKYFFSINYPNTWFDKSNEREISFANVNVEGPMEMGTNGVWMRIDPNFNYEEGYTYDYRKIFEAKLGKVESRPIANITKLEDLTITGRPVVKFIYETSPGAQTEYSYVVGYAVKRENKLYLVTFLTSDKNATEKNNQLFNQILSTFKFTQ